MASSSNWTVKQNKLFENALATYNEDAPDRWENIAKAISDKTVEEVKVHYEKLLHDINLIESDLIPLPKYKTTTITTRSSTTTTRSSSTTTTTTTAKNTATTNNKNKRG